jgi:hypothetical protein
VDRLKTTSPKVEVKTYDYTPSKDFYKSIREREQAEKKRLEKWRKELKSMSTYSTSVGNLPGSVFTSGGYINSPTITTSSLSSSAITINGDPTSGSMRVDVPLIVNGRDVIKELDEMRDALLLLKRDVDMEAKYPKLKELKDQYETALAKYKTFDTLKESK